MNQKQNTFLPLIITISVSVGILIGFFYYQNNSSGSYDSSDKIQTVLRYIEELYVDSVSIEQLEEETIPMILSGLDPHSVYLNAEQAKRENEPLEGGFSGIGIQFNMIEDTVIVINAIANGPSQKVGILAGDRIVKVENTNVAGVKMPSDSVVKRLKGKKGTKVKVTVLRPSSNEMYSFEIIRDNIPLHSVDIAYMLTPNIGYIKINQFGRTTVEEFIEGVEKLKIQGMEKLILDLRGNGGGYLDAAIHLADQFLPKGKLIVYTAGRAGSNEEREYATEQGICENEELVVLIDEFSASASEIVAGAIQDQDRGTIIGRRSFGKGLVQKPIDLPDGSTFRITIARYYTPTGRCIQKPYKKGDKEYEMDIFQRYENGEFSSKDSIKLNDSLKYYTPKNKVVYGGGGIMPDIFVPIENDGVNSYYKKIRNQGLVYTFAFEYTDKNRSNMKNLKDHKAISDYLEKQLVLQEFYRFAEKKGLEYNQKEAKQSAFIIETQIKAYIARNLIDNEGYYPIAKEIDETLKKAINELSDK